MKNHKFCTAPMLDWTDRHCRYFFRLLSKHAFLYSEMVTTGALLFGDRDRFLKFDPMEKPVALQLGGSTPKELADCAKMVEDYGYDEVNLNVGCPSDRVQNGRFGACLMASPELVAECIDAMNQAVSIPVSVKTRIGIDDRDSYEDLYQFVDQVSSAGCRIFIIHARKAWLKGLSPKQNREIPPLQYDKVFNIKNDFKDLEIIINGGIADLNEVPKFLEYVDGVMLGREIYHNPYLLSEVDSKVYGDLRPVKTRTEILEMLIPYVKKQISNGVRLNSMTRHILGLFHGEVGAKAWRRFISENAHLKSSDERILIDALALQQR